MSSSHTVVSDDDSLLFTGVSFTCLTLRDGLWGNVIGNPNLVVNSHSPICNM